MNSQRYNFTAHIIASIGSVTILVFLPTFFYLLGILITADIGGPLNIILIPCSNLCVASVFIGILCFPVLALLDHQLQKARLSDRIRAISLLITGVIFVLGLVFVIGSSILVWGITLENPFFLKILGNQDADMVIVWWYRYQFFGGVPLLLGVVTYWILLQSGRLVMRAIQTSKRK